MLGFILCWTIPGWMLELDVPWVCLLRCFPLCNENKILKYPWDLEVAKMGMSAVGDIEYFFFPSGEGVLSVECGKDCQEHGWEGV